MVRSANVKKTKKFKENCPENYHVHDTNLLSARENQRHGANGNITINNDVQCRPFCTFDES